MRKSVARDRDDRAESAGEAEAVRLWTSSFDVSSLSPFGRSLLRSRARRPAHPPRWQGKSKCEHFL